MIAAYCWPQSACAGEAITLFCHTDARHYRMTVIRQGAEDKQVYAQPAIIGQQQLITDDIAEQGCHWKPSLELHIDSAWPSGFYLVRLETASGEKCDAFFVVRSIKPAGALMVLSTSTWNAYNTWGGPSYYTGGHITSPMRPLTTGFLDKADPHRHRLANVVDWSKVEARKFAATGYDQWSMAAGWANWELLFVRWAEAQGFKLGYAVSQDLEQRSALEGYSAYLSVGHDEYWSGRMRDTVEDFVDQGGNAAFFSGNTAFWQVRFDQDYRSMTCYKCDLEADPLFSPGAKNGSAPELATMWSDPLIGRPENHMTGVSFTRGGYAHMPNSPRGSGGYSICNPGHWAFESTGLRAGDTLGAEGIVVGYECDGCELHELDGNLAPTGNDGTPDSFTVLATAPARLWETEQAPKSLADNFIGELNWAAERLAGEDTPENRAQYSAGHAVMGSFERGKGEVFTTGCTDWAYGLTDPQVATVTTNVLKRFLIPNAKPR